jgi:hypothetical protein
MDRPEFMQCVTTDLCLVIIQSVIPFNQTAIIEALINNGRSYALETALKRALQYNDKESIDFLTKYVTIPELNKVPDTLFSGCSQHDSAIYIHKFKSNPKTLQVITKFHIPENETLSIVIDEITIYTFSQATQPNLRIPIHKSVRLEASFDEEIKFDAVDTNLELTGYSIRQSSECTRSFIELNKLGLTATNNYPLSSYQLKNPKLELYH